MFVVYFCLQCRVLYDFSGETDNGELTIYENEVLQIIRQDVGEGWWEAENPSGQRGLVPEAYVEVRMNEDQDQVLDPVCITHSIDGYFPVNVNYCTIMAAALNSQSNLSMEVTGTINGKFTIN